MELSVKGACIGNGDEIVISNAFDKQFIASEIKRIIYKVFFQEMALIDGDFSDLAQGNTQLAQDLKKLFCVSFNRGDEIAQRSLNEFCDKWDLEKIEISDAPTF